MDGTCWSKSMPEHERRALLGDRESVIRVVSALRKYRDGAAKLLLSRYRDGECDAVQLNEFYDACADAEEDTA